MKQCLKTLLAVLSVNVLVPVAEAEVRTLESKHGELRENGHGYSKSGDTETFIIAPEDRTGRLTPNSRYGGHAFGFNGNKAKQLSGFDEFLANRGKILTWIAEYSPYALVTADDPPIYMEYPTPPALGKYQRDPTHTANFGVKLQEKCKSAGVPCELVYPGAPDVKHKTMQDFLIDQLKAPTK